MSEEASGIHYSKPSPQSCCSSSKDSAPKQTFDVTPQQLKQFPKAGKRKTTINRRKRKSAVSTDTPIKAELEAKAAARQERKRREKLF
ncbi:hypothetical protein JTB14_015540 [Gonioctena quinquepunctata]|nr:hypothetical protein JTB14_015540 [Gonioctena quinquepunctata]